MLTIGCLCTQTLFVCIKKKLVVYTKRVFVNKVRLQEKNGRIYGEDVRLNK